MLLGVWDKRWLCCGVCETMLKVLMVVKASLRSERKESKEKERKKKSKREKKRKSKKKNQVNFEFVFVLWLWDLLSSWAMLSLFDTYYEMRIELGTYCCGDWRNLGVFRFPDF